MNNDSGHEGEALACDYLREQGYAILETNWRMGRNEVDIIAYMEGLIVFVEVKTRKDAIFKSPEEFVDRKKQRTYIRMADAYVVHNRKEEEVRFDIITVIMPPNQPPQLHHLVNAFTTVG